MRWFVPMEASLWTHHYIVWIDPVKGQRCITVTHGMKEAGDPLPISAKYVADRLAANDWLEVLVDPAGWTDYPT